jgi:hypothetical protein
MLPEMAFARIALGLTGDTARSALPGAPTVEHRHPRRRRVRRRAAVTLHRLADRLQTA